jgi:thymidylate synthase
MHLHTRNVNTAFHELVHVFANKDSQSRRIPHSECPIVKKPSRNGKVLMIDEPVTITYSHPRERVLFNQARDCNPFFHLYEALWMLAGRNDVAPLAYYASKMKDFSDDGETFNGAYGDRWRWATTDRFGDDEGKSVDQLDILVNHLKADPTSRRAVLQMWNVEDDLLKLGHYTPCVGGKEKACKAGKWVNRAGIAMLEEGANCPYCKGTGKLLKDFSKDVCCNLSVMFSIREAEGISTPADDFLDMTVTNRSNDMIWGALGANYCLSADTKLASPEGNITVKELTDKFGSGELSRYPVYSFDTKTKDFRLSWCTRAWKTGRKKVLEIGWDDGTTSRMTADHRLFRKKRNSGKFCEEVRAGELKLGDRVWAGKLWTTASGRKQIPKRLGVSTSGGNVENVARAYWEFVNGPLPEGYVVHHRDEDKTNDRIDNLEAMTRGGHGRHHIAKAHPMHASGANAKQRASRRRFFDAMTAEQWKKWSDDRKKKPSNHVVVSIREAGVEDVYDFTVPGDHNAMLDNGVMVHNCHFTFLQEYMAARLGVEVGKYHHFTNNLHVYDWNWKPEEWLGQDQNHYLYDRKLIPLIKDPAVFEKELPKFVETYSGESPSRSTWADWQEPFFSHVAEPMMQAFFTYKQRDKPDRTGVMELALQTCENIRADDWRIACTNWLKKRINNRKGKTNGGE